MGREDSQETYAAYKASPEWSPVTSHAIRRCLSPSA